MKCPFPIYTDPTLHLYRALGLTRQTGDAGLDSDAGDYLVQTTMEATMATIKRATQMPLRNPGHFTQLGGEFVFDGTLNTIYTHRMTTTRSHSPIRDICAVAGVSLEWIHYEPGPSPPPVHRRSIIAEEDEGEEEERETMVDANEWKIKRNEEIERMKQMKEMRTMGAKWGETRREVRVVGQDLEEADEEGIDDMTSQYGSLGLAH